MKATRLASVVCIAIAIILAAPAHADQDSDFDRYLWNFEYYAPHDSTRFLAKTTCTRLRNGSFPDAATALNYFTRNLKGGTTAEQTYQILGASVGFYCPEQAPKLKDMPIAAAAARR